MTTRKVDSAKILQEIIDTMMHWEGDDIAEKAEEILGHPVKYEGDDLYTISEEESTETICCDHCGHEYDRHIGDECPNCSNNNHDLFVEKFGD